MYPTVDEMIEQRLFHEVHVSEIREFQKCHWAWYWKYMEKWYSRTTAKPLEFGTAMHAAMEVRYDPETFENHDKAEELAKETFTIVNQTQFEASKEAKGIFFDESVIEDYEERRELGVKMLEYYFTRIVDKEKDFKPIAVEKNFIVPMDMGCGCQQCRDKWAEVSTLEFVGLPVVLEGKIDVILEYSNGKVWVRDWKNIGRFSDTVEWLENDLQLNLYLWALWELGLDIGGFEYFESKKMVPEIPEPLKRKTGGRLYSTAKDKPYEYESYVMTVAEGDPEGFVDGLYTEYINWLKDEGPQFYRLTKVRKSAKAMEAMTPMLLNMLSDIVAIRELPAAAYPSPTKFGCIYCEFRQPCIERMNGQPYQDMLESLFDKKTKHYYE